MGVVYRAEQEKPQRQVALKIMKPGMASPEHLRRFEHEAHVLGRLHHEFIAQIYEAGTANTGHGPQPYFAMELVQGQPLTQYAGQLPIADRLRLIIQICNGVQHAHQKGVIHRDLKPANILIDESGKPKILDFGVARLTENDLETTRDTRVGQLVGTVRYMSPEQASANPEEIDTLTDVYTLGVICFELLAGRLPHDTQGLTTMAALRVVHEDEPSRLGAIDRAYRGDLDTIISKALQKEKARRYQSAATFADDLQRYLENKPVEARPPSAIYQLRKYAKRNKGLVSVVGLSVVALVGWSWLWAASTLQRERADLADQQSARLEADSHVQSARLAGQHGQWRVALDHYDQALQGGYWDAKGLRLERARALLALNATNRYLEEIQELASLSDLGEYEGPVLLLQGDILLGHDDAKAEELIKRARQVGLPPGADAYAQSLMAETTPEAIEKLRQAIALDPFQPRARTTLELLLVLLGQYSEARLELTAHETLFPEDADAKIMRALLSALEGDQATADRVLDGLTNQLDPRDGQALRTLAKVFGDLRLPDNEPDSLTGLPRLQKHLTALQPALKRLWPTSTSAAAQGQQPPSPTLLQFFPKPPLLRKGLIPALRALGLAMEAPQWLIVNNSVMGELTQAVKVHPEGTLMYLRALIFFGGFRFPDAASAAADAAKSSAVLPIRKEAYFLAAAAESYLYTQSKDPSVIRKAADHLRASLALGPLRDNPHRTIGANIALAAGDIALTRQLLEEWERISPDDLTALYLRAMTETRAGAHATALEAANRYLKLKPKDPGMVNQREVILKRLTEQYQRLVPSPDRGAKE
jgi:serine/threonine protein kinase